MSAIMRDVEDDDEDPEWEAEDPTQVPLPRSRDISCEPYPLSQSSPSSVTHSSSAPNSTASSSSSASQQQSQLQLQPPQRTTRSPKRSFDESSASTSASDTDERHLVERGRDKRTRRNTAGCDVVLTGADPDPMNDEDAAGTPELSGLGSPPSPSPSEASSSPSRCSSAFGSPPPAAAVGPEVEQGDRHPPLPIPSSSKKSRRLHPMTMGAGYERPLTRRQRKALGLPKLRPGLGLPVSPPGAIERTGSAGTIVIPGGKFIKRGGDGDGGQVKVKVEEDAEGVAAEWRRNGTGRVDVRGFRELKI